MVTMSGCFTNNAQCSQEDCIDTSHETKNNHNFCCCNKSLCNLKHRWEPAPTQPTTPEPPPQVNSNTVIYIVVFIVTFSGMLTTLAGLFMYYKQKKPAMFNEIPTTEPEVTSSSPCLAFRQIQLIEMKARGRFGTVWKAQMKPEEVAVKFFPMQDKHSENSHTDFWLITAYHHHGSLCDYLKSHTVTWPELCKIAETMSRGLMHLHDEISDGKGEGLKPAIAHRDFKSKNVLLKDDLTACIADFGLALIFTPGKPCGDTHGQVGTRRYMAPEILEGAINFTRDSFLRIDVYACGLVLWELASRCTAHGGLVKDYTLPFENELGPHPTLEEMQENVVAKKIRPLIHEHWKAHSVCCLN